METVLFIFLITLVFNEIEHVEEILQSIIIV